MKTYLEAIKSRRSIYSIEKSSPIPDARIVELVQQAVLHTPSSFNMQGSRAVVLFGKHHDRLWSIVLETLRDKVPKAQFAQTKKKIQSFADGYGTVLFFDDTAVTNRYGEKFALYKENFPVWAQQSNGILQYNVWNLLEDAGLGATIQHYNPLIDKAVRREWDLPESWLLIAQMPFGAPAGEPGEKLFQPVEERMCVFS
ncbi:nitroreductase family protein [Clostridium sp. D33t1_170424_F3]|uniref:nitroreductase family protein n=1 Tax=Clostridium sp. D33t1_170424_F3 TaxID=2787099 RepID=UPI0018AC056A|nr:nitroreductase family protein [Clostridium sp. D33t1_170424_F3]